MKWNQQRSHIVHTMVCHVRAGISGASYYEGYFANVARNTAGDYVAVSSRGNFFMTWEAGQAYWQPHNRPVARRVQNMGWTPDNRVGGGGGQVLGRLLHVHVRWLCVCVGGGGDGGPMVTL
jgi:hypothetical protein